MHYDHILAATDFSDLGDLALERAAGLAQAGATKLTVLHVLPTPTAPSPMFAHYDVSTSDDRVASAKREAERLLRERIPKSVSESEIEIVVEVRVGDPANEILACEVANAPDLIVLATHGRRGWKRWVMGSVAERIVQMASADVLTIREHDEAHAHDDL
ncbi:MAG: universal stress protein [Sandaracinaceae bacterium]